MEDLIRNAHTLFEERPSQPPPVPSNVAEATSTHTYGSLFLSPGFPQSSEIQAMGSTSRHRPQIDDGIHASSQSSSAFPSDGATVNCFAPPQATLMSPLRELSVSKMHTEGVKTTTQERLTKAKGTRESCECSHIWMRRRYRKAHPRAFYRVRQVFHSPQLRVCKLEWGLHDMYISCNFYRGFNVFRKLKNDKHSQFHCLSDRDSVYFRMEDSKSHSKPTYEMHIAHTRSAPPPNSNTS